MTAARSPVRADVLTADLNRLPTVWPAYRHGLYEAYREIGAGDLAIGPGLPAGVSKVVVAIASPRDIVGGVLLRERAEIGRYTGLAQVADAIAERVPEGVNEIGGCWISPAWRGAGLGTTLVREALRAAAGEVRWTVALANQFSVGISAYVGFVPDPRFRDLPFPDNRFRSTLGWFDHRGEA
jgi:RimJ/RimL family protein N-acetyltransferase